jgi:hypothetical protein
MNNENQQPRVFDRKRKHHELEQPVLTQFSYSTRKVMLVSSGTVKIVTPQNSDRNKPKPMTVMKKQPEEVFKTNPFKHIYAHETGLKRAMTCSKPKICKKFFKALEDDKKIDKLAVKTNYSKKLRNTVLRSTNK